MSQSLAYSVVDNIWRKFIHSRISFQVQVHVILVLSFSPSWQDIPPIVQLISYGRTVNLHTGGEHNKIVPLRHNVEEKVDVRPLVHEESHWMSIDDHWHLQKWDEKNLHHSWKFVQLTRRDRVKVNFDLMQFSSLPLQSQHTTHCEHHRAIFSSSRTIFFFFRWFHLSKMLSIHLKDSLTVKSCGVPGFIVGFLGRPSWCEWMSVSSRSSTRVFRCTRLNRCLETAGG